MGKKRSFIDEVKSLPVRKKKSRAESERDSPPLASPPQIASSSRAGTRASTSNLNLPNAQAPTDATQGSASAERLQLRQPGLHVIFDSSSDSQRPGPPELDVVAVHGLNFRGNVDHAADTWTKNDTLWLRDFLPSRLPKLARVMLFAYNSSPALSATITKLDEHAESLLQALSLKRENCENRPIIFIGHSLGGLVVKEALVQAILDAKRSSIVQSTCLLVCFATPHQGGNHTQLGEVIAKIVRAFKGAPQNDLLKALQHESSEAVKRFNQSRNLANKLFFVNFYEELPYGHMGLIVNKDSATLGYPSTLETVVKVHANHSTICKFDSVSDTACDLVLRTIAMESKAALDRWQGASFYTKTDEDKHFLASLRSTDVRLDKKRIERAKGGLWDDSYRWILENPEFKQWLEAKQDQLLWVKGDPGKGKTMLLCGIINELDQQRRLGQRHHIMSFFFCQGTDNRLNSAVNVLRGLLYHLLDEQPWLIKRARARYDNAGPDLFNDVNTWSAVTDMLDRVLEDPNLGNPYFLIDALDECSTDQGELLDWIVRTSSQFPQVKWIVSSRNWTEIEKGLSQATQKAILSLELNDRAVVTAVHSYIDWKSQDLAIRNHYTQNVYTHIRQVLMDKAHGTFLWVALVCHELKNLAGWEAIKAVEILPPGLGPLYERMLEKIHRSPRAALASTLLAVMSTVYRPMTVDELPALVELPEGFEPDSKDTEDLIMFCGFFTLQRRTISFVHQSAKDFLRQNTTEPFRSRLDNTHYSIFIRSVDILLRTLRRDMYSQKHPGISIHEIRPPEPNPLRSATYSCVYWLDHLYECGEQNIQTELQDNGRVDRFIRQKFIYWLEALSLLHSMSAGLLSIIKIQEYVKESSPNLASLAQDAHRFVQYHRITLDAYPLQCYAAALMCSPTESIIRKLFRTEEPEWLVSRYFVGSHWTACLMAISGEGECSIALDYSTGRHLATQVMPRDSVKIWDLSTFQCLATVRYRDKYDIDAFTWSADGRLTTLSSGNESRGSVVRIWNPTITHYRTLVHTFKTCFMMAWSTYGCLALAYEHNIDIWDGVAGSPRELFNLDDGSEIWWIAWSPDGRLGVATRDKIHIFDRNGIQSPSKFNSMTFECNFAWSVDGWLAYPLTRDTIRIVEPTMDLHKKTLDIGSHFVTSLAWSPDGRLASGSSHAIQIWDPATGQCLTTLPMNWASDMVWSPDGRFLIINQSEGIIKILDPEVGSHELAAVSSGPNDHHLAWSNDGRLLATSINEKNKIWTSSGDLEEEFIDKRMSNISSWSPEGRILLRSVSGIMEIWDVFSKETHVMLQGTSQELRCDAWSPDGQWVAMEDITQVIHVWDTSTGVLLSKLPCESYSHLTWSSDGRLAFRSYDTINIWHCDTKLCQKIHTADWLIGAMSWSTDGRLVAAYEQVIQLWDPATAKLLGMWNISTSITKIEKFVPPLLYTDKGILEIPGEVISPDPGVAVEGSFVCNAEERWHGLGIFDNNWLTYNGRRLLYLAMESPVWTMATWGTRMALSCGSGRVVFLQVLEDKLDLP